MSEFKTEEYSVVIKEIRAKRVWIKATTKKEAWDKILDEWHKDNIDFNKNCEEVYLECPALEE